MLSLATCPRAVPRATQQFLSRLTHCSNMTSNTCSSHTTKLGVGTVCSGMSSRRDFVPPVQSLGCPREKKHALRRSLPRQFVIRRVRRILSLVAADVIVIAIRSEVTTTCHVLPEPHNITQAIKYISCIGTPASFLSVHYT